MYNYYYYIGCKYPFLLFFLIFAHAILSTQNHTISILFVSPLCSVYHFTLSKYWLHSSSWAGKYLSMLTNPVKPYPCSLSNVESNRTVQADTVYMETTTHKSWEFYWVLVSTILKTYFLYLSRVMRTISFERT